MNIALSPPEQRNRTRLTWLAYAALMTGGINLAWLGPFLPDIARSCRLTLDRAGLIFSAMSAGYMAALLLGGAVSRSLTSRAILSFSMVLASAGFILMASALGLPLLLLGVVSVGLGYGGVDIAANALVAEMNRERYAASLNYLHMMFGAGALLGPIIAGLAIRNSMSYAIEFDAAAILTAAIGLALSLTAAPVSPRPVPVDGQFLMLANPLLWVITAVLFLYVGAETGVAGWLAEYLHLRNAMRPSFASFAVSIYWLGLMTGRLIAAQLPSSTPPRGVALSAGFLSAAALMVLVIAPVSLPLHLLAIFLVGFGYGPIFPNMVAIGAERFPDQMGQFNSIAMSGGAVGSMLFPWVMGVVLVSFGARPSMSIALVVTVAMTATTGTLFILDAAGRRALLAA